MRKEEASDIRFATQYVYSMRPAVSADIVIVVWSVANRIGKTEISWAMSPELLVLWTKQIIRGRTKLSAWFKTAFKFIEGP